MRFVQLAATIATTAAVVLTVGCASSEAPRSTAAATASASPSATATSMAADANAIQITMFKYAPATLQVPRGSTVMWTNQDQILHTVSAGTPTAKSPLFDQRMPDVGAKFAYEFKDAGTFPFFCDIHQFMTGEVVVR